MPSRRQSVQLRKRLRLAALAARPPHPAAEPKVAITDLTARAVQEPVGRRSYVVVEVRTNTGVVGLGEAAAQPDPATVAARLRELKPRLVGQDALAAEAVQRALGSAADDPAQEMAAARAAINIALLDILGKLSKAPIYEILSGRTRHQARAFARIEGSDLGTLRDSLQRALSAGHKAFSVPLILPQGPTRGRAFYRQAHRLVESLRETAGDDADFILDCAGGITPAEAAGLATEFERFHLLWLEEPTSKINRQALAKISSESATPLGLGREILHNGGFQDLLRMDAVDVLRPGITRMGISEIRKAAALAETYYVAVAPFHSGGPIGTAAALQVAASIPNFFIQEVPFPADNRDLEMRQRLVNEPLESVNKGVFELPAGPGLGVTLNEAAVREYELKI